MDRSDACHDRWCQFINGVDETLQVSGLRAVIRNVRADGKSAVQPCRRWEGDAGFLQCNHQFRIQPVEIGGCESRLHVSETDDVEADGCEQFELRMAVDELGQESAPVGSYR